MAIEANVEIIEARAGAVESKAHEFAHLLNRFRRNRAYLVEIGSSMSNPQKAAAITAANQAATDLNTAVTALTAAWTATQPIVE